MGIPTHRSPILVTGAHRSGTTFVGKMLSIRSEIGYIHEPFNKDHGLEAIDRWFLYLKEGLPNDSAYASLITDLLCGRGVYKLGPKRNEGPLRATLRSFLRSKENVQYIWNTKDPRVKRYLIKDPIACLSSEYLHRKFSMEVVIVVRHPAAFVSSLRRMNWQFDFSDFLNQPALIDDHMGPILKGHDLHALSEVEEAALLWKCIYSTLMIFAQRNPRMIAIRHEDISYEPSTRFRRLYERLGIVYTARCERKIEAYTKASNPAAPVAGRVHTLMRDSRSNVQHWKKVLTRGEIDIIRSLTRDVCDAYYSPDDW